MKLGTVKDAAEFLKCSESQIRLLARQGKIDATRNFGNWLIDIEGLEKLVKQTFREREDMREAS